jgi:DNA polymerase-4
MIWEAAMDVFRHSHTSGKPVRSLSVKVTGLAPADEMTQLSLFSEERKAQRRTDIDRVIDRIRAKYGYFSIRRAITLLDPALDLDAKGDHTIHPVGFLGTL